VAFLPPPGVEANCPCASRTYWVRFLPDLPPRAMGLFMDLV
jgi:hypothetical protein